MAEKTFGGVRAQERRRLLVGGLAEMREDRLVAFLLATVLASATVLGFALLDQRQAEAAVPSGFTRELVATVDTPITIRFLPGGDALVSEKSGQIYRLDVTSVPSTPVLWLDIANINSGAERGLIDFAIDPDYTNNGRFYVFYSAGSPANFRVSAFTDAGSPAATLATEQVLWTDPTGYISCCHMGAGLDIGPDGKLWFTPGDKFTGSRAQDLTHADGKVIRINTDGSIPDGTDGWPANPYISPTDGKLDSIWAYGLRNPFRARWDIPTGRFFIAEVGGNSNAAWEDIHVSGLDDAGVNYGWPACEGPAPHTDFPDCGNTPHEDPIFAYSHDGPNGGASISGGEVYRAGVYPAEFDGAYFYGDYARQFIHYLTFDGAGNPTDNVFDDDAGLVVSMAVGPEGWLYSATLTGEIYRYRYSTGGSQSPVVANLSASPPGVGIGQAVDLSASLIDPDSTALAYEWDFGDGNTLTGSGSPGPVSTTHTYSATGSYNVTLMVDDGESQTTSAPITVQVGTPPSVQIDSPVDGSLFIAGDTINFSAPAPGPGESYEWEVVFTHNDHTHPVLDGYSDPSGSFVVSDSGHDYSGDTGYRITLTVTDSFGLTNTAEVSVVPDKVDVIVDASPSGITIDVDGVPQVTAATIDTLKQFRHDVIAQPSRCIAGTIHDFAAWSHGEPSSHTYVVPNSNATIVATYTDTGSPCAAAPPVTSGLAMRLSGNSGVTVSGTDVTGWADQTVNGNDVTPVGGAPTLVTGGLNGNDVIAFDGVDDALGRTGFTGLPVAGNDRTVIMVARYDSTGWGGFSYGTHSCQEAFGLVVTSGGNLGVQGWCGDVNSGVPINGAGWSSQAVMLEAGTGSLYKDGALIGTFSRTFQTGSTELRIGSELDDSPHIDMDVAEILVYDRALSAAELESLETWIQTAYFEGTPPAGPTLAVSSPTEGASIAASDVDVTWDVTSGAQAGDEVAVSLDGATPILAGTSGSHTFTGVVDGPHTITVTVRDSTGTPYSNPEAAITRNVVVATGGGSVGDVPIADGLVLDLGGGQNFSTAGSTVIGWLDRSGLGNDLSLGGGAPSLGVVTPSGVAAVSFDGSDDELERTAALTGFPSGSQDRTMFVVARYDAGKWGGVVFGDTAKRKAFGLGINKTGNLYVNGWSYNAVTSTFGRGSGWFVHSAVVSSDAVTQYDGTSVIGTSSRTYETDLQRLVIGSDLGSNFVDMDVAAVLVYDRALTPAEHTQVANYLGAGYLNETPGADTDPPVITLSGSAAMTVAKDAVWSEPGYSATDNVDGDVTASVVVGGDAVDTSTVGTYVITYDVTDAAGNPADQVSRMVTVEEDPPPPAGDVPVTDGLALELQADGVQTSGSTVIGWLDASPNANSLSLGGGAPSLGVVTPSGVAAVSFDGSDDELERTAALTGFPSGSQDRTMFVVARYDAGKWGGVVFGDTAKRKAFGLGIRNNGNLYVNGWAYNAYTSTPGRGSGWFVHSAVVSSDAVTQYDGTSVIGTSSRTYETDLQRLVIGSDLGSNFVDMDVAAVLVYDRALTPAEHTQVANYLNSTYLQ